MRIVLAALSRPLTVVVALLTVALCAILAVKRMPVDIFPQVGDPAIYVAQPYGGMDPAQMEGYLTYYYEYHFLYITGIDHVESKSVQGAALMKLVFHEGTNMSQAMAETVGYVNRARAFMPPGAVPPFITRFDAGSVAVGQLVFSSATHTQGELQDFALNRVRPLFATLPGVSAPPPFGGNQRTIVITLNPAKLQQYQISPDEAIVAVSKSSLVMPSGNMWTGKVERIARTNAALGGNLSELLSTPIHPASGTNIYLRDIGSIESGTDIVTAYAHVNGKRTVYIPVTKRADASTLAVIQAVKANLPEFRKVLPDGVDVRLEFDQSPYVTNSINGLVTEGLLGAALTGLMVLLFLRDWRSALIVVLNIPFALLAAVVALWATGQTINIMTLGGLALAVGVLVDEATVEIENIHSQMLPGVSRARAVLEACSRTAMARLLSMFCILAVFVPSFFMVGVGRQLFVPLSLAVGFSMIASYLLSSSLVPVFSLWLMKEGHRGEEHEGLFGRLRSFYESYLRATLKVRWPLAAVYLVASIGLVYLLLPRLGTEIFPDADAPLLRMRLRAATGTRIEETERIVLRALDSIQGEIGANNVRITSDFVGIVPSSYPVNLIHLFTSGPQEAVIQVALQPGVPRGEALRERLRQRLGKDLPGVRISFEAADIVSQVISFGSPTPVEVAVQGISLQADYDFAHKLQGELAKLAFLRDLQIAQASDFPTVDINIDRERAGQFGLTMSDVVRSVVPATSSSRFTQPNYWRDPASGNAFQIQLQLPQNQMQSVESLGQLPVMQNGRSQPRLTDVAAFKLGTMPGMIERYNGQHVVSLTANLHGPTLGEAVIQINRAIAAAGAPPKGVTVKLRGEVPALEQTLSGLRLGLLLAVLVIFLLLSANFQSVRLALAIVLTIPAVLCGVAIMLLATGTTLNVQSFMGAIMAIGIAVANSILLVTFAERARHEGRDHLEAAQEGSAGRLRAVLMTAAAMIFGMVPMAIGIGEGGAQSAPLGRAVIGGLIASTFTTLTVLPSIYAILQRKASTNSPSLNPMDPESRYYEAH
ncbi:efflux RND transporter permease subunit [Paludibaculum fermentans]|uniref:Efflux RND transporter permease subunit n=1 Tax=Paludibaculum fermentans TaxID=1473598 RepID=A0A7S7SI76_PALFE|nr:efflux RND transporter permease subunit [Paludibaculum fermentans]QOY85418.1 efflux RND transporter permease subunit [Paludibaculum fermentans]